MGVTIVDVYPCGADQVMVIDVAKSRQIEEFAKSLDLTETTADGYTLPRVELPAPEPPLPEVTE